MGILSLIPFKDWLYGGVIVGLLAVGGWYTVHERHIGAAHEAAAVTKVAVAAEAKVTAANTAAQTSETKYAKLYDQTVANLAVPSVGLVCHRTGGNGNTLPATGTGVTPGAGQPASDSGAGPAWDPSGALLTRAALADAQISYLQSRIHELETQMENAP